MKDEGHVPRARHEAFILHPSYFILRLSRPFSLHPFSLPTPPFPPSPLAPDRIPPVDRLRRLAPFLKPLFVLVLFAISLRVLQQTLTQYHFHDVIVFLREMPREQIVVAVLLTLIGYLVITRDDTLAFRYIR